MRTCWGRAAKAGLAVGAIALYLDESGVVRPWRWVCHTVRVPGGGGKAPAERHLRVLVKQKPPPIGCTEWPAGRVLLEWAMGEVPPKGATVLEFGAGVGVTALGLALSSSTGDEPMSGEAPRTKILATDVCEASLQNMRANAAANGIDCNAPMGAGVLSVGVWDAAGGEAAVHRLFTDFGLNPSALTHVVGGDVMYHGFEGAAADANQGLASTLAALLNANPNINVTLLLVDRFSGGTVAAVSQVRKDFFT
jgi:predicted nicotinamide N-methyase